MSSDSNRDSDAATARLLASAASQSVDADAVFVDEGSPWETATIRSNGASVRTSIRTSVWRHTPLSHEVQSLNSPQPQSATGASTSLPGTFLHPLIYSPRPSPQANVLPEDPARVAIEQGLGGMQQGGGGGGHQPKRGFVERGCHSFYGVDWEQKDTQGMVGGHAICVVMLAEDRVSTNTVTRLLAALTTVASGRTHPISRRASVKFSQQLEDIIWSQFIVPACGQFRKAGAACFYEDGTPDPDLQNLIDFLGGGMETAFISAEDWALLIDQMNARGLLFPDVHQHIPRTYEAEPLPRVWLRVSRGVAFQPGAQKTLADFGILDPDASTSDVGGVTFGTRLHLFLQAASSTAG
uniref:Uncharacterized protein n=1 Tax=Chromera velia CCMP2878 TaxID=1169474 RepID=A0A0G4I1K7_9ALVE|eukprot:Cvel_34774.t1-p1 / transcript=Cvel_34774.t1 / gene=Cvel_34774 / organism=Chromera_velia_CCMP2878 / gene_product=hypothetical protein / transcript_product=hypothetical protein / location=Cvel_scaffold6083:2201-3256(-) / protein_length=352 / sequence_SO=supercontig / SO=protein_coding / is_pseudo=false